VDKIIARVGGDIILLSDLVKQINQMKSANLYREGMTESEVLAQMIESRLIIQKARELNYTVDESKIKSAAEARIKDIKKRFASEEEYQRELRRMKLTNSELLKYFTDTLTEQALTQQFYQKQIAVKVTVSEKEMRDFYNLHKDSLAVKPVTWNIGMILRQIEPSEATDKAQLNAIKAIQERLRSGENFEDVARTDSQCPSAAQGGDLGFFTKGMMVKPFEDAAFALKVGEISDIVKTQYGYHLIKLEEKRNDEIRVRHILKLVEPSAADSLAARQLMEDIRNQFLSGKSFTELAAQWSMDTDSAKDGGSIGEYGENDFPELFAPVLKALQVGAITQVLENEGMLYLFTKMNEVPSRLLSFDEVSKQVRELVSRQKQIQVYDEWIDQLKKENYVEIML
jgi:peptidyl-prolyl cis-trans isomerase SurA